MVCSSKTKLNKKTIAHANKIMTAFFFMNALLHIIIKTFKLSAKMKRLCAPAYMCNFIQAKNYENIAPNQKVYRVLLAFQA